MQAALLAAARLSCDAAWPSRLVDGSAVGTVGSFRRVPAPGSCGRKRPSVSVSAPPAVLPAAPLVRFSSAGRGSPARAEACQRSFLLQDAASTDRPMTAHVQAQAQLR